MAMKTLQIGYAEFDKEKDGTVGLYVENDSGQHTYVNFNKDNIKDIIKFLEEVIKA